LIARVVTDVAGIEKEFDYLVPEGSESRIEIGTEVRLPLGGRRVGGWVVDLPDAAPEGVKLRPLAKVRGVGPDAAMVDLCRWAAWRWAGKHAWFLHTASAERAIRALPARSTPRPPARPSETAVALPPGAGVHVLELAPATDPTPVVAAAAQLGPALVVVPSPARAAILAGRLRRAGGDVALLPGDWVGARNGSASVVVGTRSAALGPCPGLSSVVVLDAHDEALTAEGAPTWSAVTVLTERARQAGAPLYALTPSPTAELLADRPFQRQERGGALAGWALTEVLDRRGDDPRKGMWSTRVVDLVRAGGKVALVLNRTGRVRLLACSACGELAHCEVCAAAVSSPAPGLLRCDRCGHERPAVCTRCGSTRLKNLRVGVRRAAEELAVLAGRPVGEVTASTTELPAEDVLIGTEALLHRLDPTSGFSTVVFVDFDQELLVPRVGAASQAMSLVARAARVVRGRAGRIVIQTRLPDHPVVRAAVHADPMMALEGEEDLRRQLRLPPFASIALVYGDAAGPWVEGLTGLDVSGPDAGGRWMVRAGDPEALCNSLASNPRPAVGSLRVAVEPARW
jgi:primosomal protein N' (replication factor Y)